MTKSAFYSHKPDNRIDHDALPKHNPAIAGNPQQYLPTKGLVEAVNVALQLGLPLLLTGEPGVGKSSLAHSLNMQMGYQTGELIHLTVKSDTRHQELFYDYDTLGRFHAAHNDKTKTAQDFIRYRGLGLAILRAKVHDDLPKKIFSENELAEFKATYPTPRRSVVLIDEIDKAPREMLNDILNEIERMEFRIPELFIDEPIKLTESENRYRPIVIITSNSERDLPEAFLRRCLYYHLSIPPFQDSADDDTSIEEIVTARLGTSPSQSALLSQALSFFRYCREEAKLERKPSLAELLDWLRYLHPTSDNSSTAFNTLMALKAHPLFESSVKTCLLKTKSDQKQFEKLRDSWKR